MAGCVTLVTFLARDNPPDPWINAQTRALPQLATATAKAGDEHTATIASAASPIDRFDHGHPQLRLFLAEGGTQAEGAMINSWSRMAHDLERLSLADIAHKVRNEA